jgi:hypothetical protein
MIAIMVLFEIGVGVGVAVGVGVGLGFGGVGVGNGRMKSPVGPDEVWQNAKEVARPITRIRYVTLLHSNLLIALILHTQ